MVISKEQVHGTGVPNQFTYSFDFQNLSGVPVKFLYLFPTTNCQSVTPGILTFNPPVPPGATTNVTVTITVNAPCSTNLCFLFSAHTATLAECCSLVHCTAAAAPQPALAITLSGTNVVLSWPDSYPNYVLVSATRVSPPPAWTPVGITYVFSNGRIYVTVPITVPTRFFQLRFP